VLGAGVEVGSEAERLVDERLPYRIAVHLAVPPLSRFDARAGLVALRQTFVRSDRAHEVEAVTAPDGGMKPG
jgi:hypothetical protein